MKTATKTATSRKAMRVATCFTGAAAAAVAFGPAALAAPGHAPAQGHTALVNGKTEAVEPDTHSGSIRSAGCNANDVHWLHIEYSSPFQRRLCKAFGYVGYFNRIGVSMIAQCGGNNYGYLYSSRGRSWSFGPGNTYRNLSKPLSGVYIYAWGGNDKCAWPR